MPLNTNDPTQRTYAAPGQQWSPDTFPVLDGAPAVQLASADRDRRALTVYTDPDSAGVLYLVANPGQRTGGMRIVPGAGYTWDIPPGSPVYGYAVGGDVIVTVVSVSGWGC